MFQKMVLLVLVVLVLMPAFDAFAYDRNAATKLGRGLSNAATCWVEIPKQVFLVSKEREPFTGLVYGGAKGVCYTIMRLANGVYDTALFLVPPYDKPLMEDEFVFEGWDE